jgi:uncharacterized membrane protein YccC
MTIVSHKPTALARLKAQFGAWKAPLRQGARMGLTCVAAALLAEASGLPQGYWAVFTAVIVLQTTVGGTLKASAERFGGTVAGAVIGGLGKAAATHHGQAAMLEALALAVIVTGALATWRPSLKVAPVTAVIVLISPVVGLNPVMEALARVAEIAIGGGVAVVGSLIIFPTRAVDLAAKRIDEALNGLADVLVYLNALVGPGAPDKDQTASDIHDRHEQIRAGLANLETALDSAQEEHKVRLATPPFQAAVPRTLWRVRNDVVAIGRTVLDPLPEQVATLMVAPIRDMIAKEATFMRGLGAQAQGGPKPERAARDAAHAAFHEALEQLRRERLTADQTFDSIGHVFGLAFALDGLHRNLTDLADRLDEARAGRGG